MKARGFFASAALGGGALLLFACGGQSSGAGGESDTPPAGGPAAPATSLPRTGVQGGGVAPNPFSVCPAPLGSAEELARTPRADTELELLALVLDAGPVTATQATYERVVADVGVIRAFQPSYASVTYFPPHNGYSMLVDFGEDATEAFYEGEYTAWDCLLEAYRVTVGPVTDIFGTYTPEVYLGGIFDLPRVAEVFDRLPDASVRINATDGRRGELCVTRAGEHYEYVVDRTDTGCDSTARCNGTARHFVSDVPGEVTLLDTWVSTPDDPAPGWFRDICK